MQRPFSSCCRGKVLACVHVGHAYKYLNRYGRCWELTIAYPQDHPPVRAGGGALSNSPGQTLSSGSVTATRAVSRTAAGSSSPGERSGGGRGASPGSGQAPEAAAQAAVGGSFASPFEAEVLRRKTASEPNSPHESPPHAGSPHGLDRARRAPQAPPLASPAVRQVLSFESASLVTALP